MVGRRAPVRIFEPMSPETWTARAAVQGTVSGRSVDLTIMDDVGTSLSGEVSGNTMVCIWTSGDGTTGTGTLLRE